MVISLLLGNLLMVAIAAAGPMYSAAALQRTLTRNLSTYYTETNNDPGTIILQAELSASKKAGHQTYEQVLEAFDRMTEELHVRALQRVNQYYISNLKAVPDISIDDAKNRLSVRLTSYTDLEDHIRIMNGTMYSDQLVDNTIDVIVSENTFVSQQLMLGQEMTLGKLEDAEGQPYRLRVTGIFENSMEQDSYGRSSPSTWNDLYVMDEGLFRELFLSSDAVPVSVNIEPYVLLDYTEMRGDAVADYLAILDRYQEHFEELGRELELFKKEFPDKQAYINLLPMYANKIQLIGGAWKAPIEYYDDKDASYQDYLDAYIANVDTDYICTDIYPCRREPDPACPEKFPAEYIKTTYGNYVKSIEIVANACRKSGRDFWCCIQSEIHALYRY